MVDLDDDDGRTGASVSFFFQRQGVWLPGWGGRSLWIGDDGARHRHQGDDDLCRKGWRMDGPPAFLVLDMICMSHVSPRPRRTIRAEPPGQGRDEMSPTRQSPLMTSVAQRFSNFHPRWFSPHTASVIAGSVPEITSSSLFKRSGIDS